MDETAAIWVPVPKITSEVREAPANYAPRCSPAKRDYLVREARNRALGRAGEEFVLQLEARRLYAAGQRRLSKRVAHLTSTKTDGLGYEVWSFEDEGRERLIRAKTTAFSELTLFFRQPERTARAESAPLALQVLAPVRLPRPRASFHPFRCDSGALPARLVSCLARLNR
ncbi:MAG: hypothetical protein ABIU96_14285 [Rhodanobacter sp.]